ncbi:MAG: hypothetical protein PHE68_00575 [Candidatus Peribacteraceae bacterium]|nr:hypothetical protein [Candidatus Peribacteraceae bacterium]
MMLLPVLSRLKSSTSFLYSVGLMSLILVSLLLTAHVREVNAMRSETVPVLGTVSTLERRLAVLKEQVEVSELDAALRMGSQEERVRVFVLPAKTALDRAMTVFDLLRDDLTKRGLLGSMSAIEVKDTRTLDGNLSATPFTVRFAVKRDGMQDIFSLVKLAGLLTVGDSLSRAEKTAMIRATEEENPAGIVALEQFFAADLAAYGHDNRSFEEQLQRSFASDSFRAMFRTILDQSILKDARTLFQSDLGSAIERGRLWPIQFMKLDYVDIRPGKAKDWYQVDVRLSLLQRGM